LTDEPGIPELVELYYDDNYDYNSGKFTGMSEKTKKVFQEDLKIFYNVFTGNKDMKPEITKFSDIKLRDYSKKPGCQSDKPILKAKYRLNKKDDLFVSYAENTKKMIQSAADNQSKLLNVINEIFTYVIDPYSSKKVIRINPKLTEESLQKAIENTRKFIVELYIKCEIDYVNGIKLYEAIVESKILETTQKQIENLQKEAKTIIKETKQASAPVPKPMPVVEPVKMPEFGSEPTISPAPLQAQAPLKPVVVAVPPQPAVAAAPAPAQMLTPLPSLNPTTTTSPI
jgi:hypothetical protein